MCMRGVCVCGDLRRDGSEPEHDHEQQRDEIWPATEITVTGCLQSGAARSTTGSSTTDAGGRHEGLRADDESVEASSRRRPPVPRRDNCR